MKAVMAVDTKTCIGCGACVLACNSHYSIDTSRSWLTECIKGDYPTLSAEFRSERCMHCENAPCVDNCPTDASYIDENGFVCVDDAKCIGCGACVESCPYDARKFNGDGLIEKCTFCKDDNPFENSTVCANACPTKSIYFGDLEDRGSEISKALSNRKWKKLKKHAGTKPKLYYLT